MKKKYSKFGVKNEIFVLALVVGLGVSGCFFDGVEKSRDSNSPFGDVVNGKAIYQANCVVCHGENGDGKGPASAAMVKFKPRDFTKGDFKYGASPDKIFLTVINGVEGTPMPAWKGQLSEAEIKDAVSYVMSLKK